MSTTTVGIVGAGTIGDGTAQACAAGPIRASQDRARRVPQLTSA